MMETEVEVSSADDGPKDFVTCFPAEIVEIIFTNLNPKAVYASLQASKLWNSFIEEDDLIWRSLCNVFDEDDVKEDLENGLSWKLIFIKNYGVEGVIRRWLKGKYSNLKYLGELSRTDELFAVLDVETWGVILDSELTRSRSL